MRSSMFTKALNPLQAELAGIGACLQFCLQGSPQWYQLSRTVDAIVLVGDQGDQTVLSQTLNRALQASLTAQQCCPCTGCRSRQSVGFENFCYY